MPCHTGSFIFLFSGFFCLDETKAESDVAALVAWFKLIQWAMQIWSYEIRPVTRPNNTLDFAVL
jgi:hypothetical protein